MKKNTIYAILCLFLTLSVPIYAKEYKIGTQTVKIPQTGKWVDVSSIDPEWVAFSQKLMPALRVLTGLWERDDVELFLLNKTPLLQRYFLISTYKKAENIFLNRNEFKRLKNETKKNFDSPTSQITERIKAAEKQASDMLSSPDNIVKINRKSMVYLGVDYEDDNILSTSLINTFVVTENGKAKISVQACVMTLIFVRGKILLLYGYTPFKEKKDLKWCQEQSLTVARGILDANLQKTRYDTGIVPKGSEISPLTQRLMSESKKTYSSAGNPKAKGIELSIDIPISWTSKESKRPNIVFNFIAPVYRKVLASCIIWIRDVPGLTPEIVSTLSADDVKKPSDFEAFFGKDIKYLRGGLTKIEGEKTIWAEGYQIAERANFKLASYVLSYMIFYKGKVISIFFACGCAPGNNQLEEVFRAYLPLFQKIAGSIVLQSKWK